MEAEGGSGGDGSREDDAHQTSDDSVLYGIIGGLAAALVLFAICDVYCRRQRGVGCCAVLLMCPQRLLGEILMPWRVRSNPVASQSGSFELSKWRPWRLDHHDRLYN